uniref:Uncharacterized protein n=1 Tax=Anguilla anguilla TaxID=7936 RepID=A0A0E9TEY8_ANGAN
MCSIVFWVLIRELEA